MEINEIYQGDSAKLMKEIPNNFIDLTVTSPPYDNLRDYKDYSFDFENIAKELYRVTKDGGIVVWVVGDATINGSETGTSFRQALYFKVIGFNLYDTMIYRKQNPIPNNSLRYTQSFEYMFVFSKGVPKTFNPILEDCIHKGKKASRTIIGRSGIRKHQSLKGVYGEKKKHQNIFTYIVGSLKEKKWVHPAKFCEQLAVDHILSWSNEGDLIFDPMCGSGTTLMVAKKLKRRYLGFEIAKEYVEIIKRRLH